MHHGSAPAAARAGEAPQQSPAATAGIAIVSVRKRSIERHQPRGAVIFLSAKRVKDGIFGSQ